MIIDLENVNGIFKAKTFPFPLFKKLINKTTVILITCGLMFSGFTSNLFNFNLNEFNFFGESEQAEASEKYCLSHMQELSEGKKQGLELCLNSELEMIGDLKKTCNDANDISKSGLCDTESFKDYLGIKQPEKGFIDGILGAFNQANESGNVVSTSISFDRDVDYAIGGTDKKIKAKQGIKVNLDQNINLVSIQKFCKIPERELNNLCDKEQFKKYIKGEVLGVVEEV